MKLSFAITVHNEFHYLRELADMLVEFIMCSRDGHQYEVVILDDLSTDEDTKKLLAILNSYEFITVHQHALNNDFATHKNFLTNLCSGEFILQLDADEMISTDVLAWIPDLISANPDCDAYWIPRINIVQGLTEEHIQKWRWNVSEIDGKVVVCWPDPQMRLYRKSPEIEWKYKVHEQLTGFNQFGTFPFTPEYAIVHQKTIERQEKQNSYYDTIQR